MSNADFILKAMCCLQTSVRGAFTGQVISAPEHIYMVDAEQDVTPFCLNHSFGSVRYLGSGPYSLTGKPSDCLRGYEEKFEVIVGVCGPQPASVLAVKGVGCSPDEIYGECPPCEESLEIEPPVTGGTCITPVWDGEGNFSWPDDANKIWSRTSFTGYLLVQRFILRERFLKVFCKCMKCGTKPQKGKANLQVVSVEPWCDGNFQGTRMVVEGNIG